MFTTYCNSSKKKSLCKRSIWKLQTKDAGKLQRIGVLIPKREEAIWKYVNKQILVSRFSFPIEDCTTSWKEDKICH